MIEPLSEYNNYNCFFMSVPLLDPLNSADTYSMTSTNKNSFETNTNLYATANPCQMLYPTTHCTIYRSFCNSTVFIFHQKLIKPSSCKDTNFCCTFCCNEEIGKTFDGLEHQFYPKEVLQQIDAHIIFTTVKNLLDPVAYNQRQKRKRADIHCPLSGIAVSWFL